MTLSSKQRAYLKSLGSNIEPIFQIGKDNLSPEVTAAVTEAFNRRELVKISVLKNASEDARGMAEMLAERSGSVLVQVIGRKIILYKPFKDKPEIVLPK